MRTFSNSVNDVLLKKHGLDPTIFIGVKWDDSGDEYFYCTQEFQGAKKQIVSMSGLETTQLLSGTGSSQTVSVTLSDTDGEVRKTLDTVDVHKRPAKVYLGFPDVPIAEAVTLIDGEINSEMKWDDRSRTFVFTIINRIEGRLFGFAMEDGLFEQVNDQDRSKPWPFRFGETCAYPAVELRNGTQGLLRIGQGVADTTLDAKICQARAIRCPFIEDPLQDPVSDERLDPNYDPKTFAQNDWNNSVDEFGQIDGGSGQDKSFGGLTGVPGTSLEFFNIINTNEYGLGVGGRDLLPVNPDNNQPLTRDRECERAKYETLCQLLRDRANQLQFVSGELDIFGGSTFPQNRPTQIRIDDVIYTGTFSGDIFTIDKTNRLDAPTDNVDCSDVGPLTKGYRDQLEKDPGSLAACEQPTRRIELQVVGGAGESWRALRDIDDSKFKWLPSGSNVYLDETSTQVHVVSLVPGLITGVYAYRAFGGTSQLTEVPTEYYEVVETDYGSFTAVEIHLTRSLDSYPDENWSNQLYVHFDSDIGPNPCDVIEWIVDNFTDFTVDATSFAAVKSALTNYPCNYYHAKKESVLQTINRIAYEARCALIITDNVVKIKYLPAEPTADKTFTEADLVAGSFSFKHSTTERLVTSQDVQWQPRGTDILSTNSVERRLTVERNVNKYGYFGSEKIYQTINNETQALKTATFWSIRESNTWRIVEFQTTLEHMNLELFDTVSLNIGQFPNVKCVITNMDVDPGSGIVNFECWTPVLSGTTEEYFFAWPANKAQEPYPGDAFEIDPPLLTVSPPEGHPLYVESQSGQPTVVATTGDRVPSDLDDAFPETICQDMNDAELIDVIQPQFDRIGFPDVDYAAQATRADEVAATGVSYNFEEPEEKVACGRPTLESCVFTVNVQYGNCTSVAPSNEPGGGYGCDVKPGPCNCTERGKRCGGPNFFICRTFGSRAMAEAYRASIMNQVERAHCSFRCGVTAPVSATLLPAAASSDCPDHDQQIGTDG